MLKEFASLDGILIAQAPHLQCSLRENRKFLKKIDQKTTHLEENYDQNSGLISDMVIQAWHLE
jgi:hypothetical protein